MARCYLEPPAAVSALEHNNVPSDAITSFSSSRTRCIPPVMSASAPRSQSAPSTRAPSSIRSLSPASWSRAPAPTSTPTGPRCATSNTRRRSPISSGSGVARVSRTTGRSSRRTAWYGPDHSAPVHQMLISCAGPSVRPEHHQVHVAPGPGPHSRLLKPDVCPRRRPPGVPGPSFGDSRLDELPCKSTARRCPIVVC